MDNDTQNHQQKKPLPDQQTIPTKQQPTHQLINWPTNPQKNWPDQPTVGIYSKNDYIEKIICFLTTDDIHF